MPILQNDIDPTWQDGVNITDTFDVWRKKTNGHIAGYKSIITNADIADLTIQSIKLAPPAPSWDQTTGTVTTNGTVGGFIVKGGFTSGLSSSINVASTASAAPALSITSSSRILRFNPNSTIGSFNPLVAAGDYSIIAGSSNSDTQNIIIGKWSNSQHGVVIGQGRVGINRVATTNAFEVQGAISATGEITGGSLNAGTGTISTAGAIYCGSLGASSGTISTTGAIIGGSLNAGTGTISTTGTIAGGTINCTSLTSTGPITGNLTGNATSATTAASCTGNSATATVAAFANDYAGRSFQPHGTVWTVGESGYEGQKVYLTGNNAYVDLELTDLAGAGFYAVDGSYQIFVELRGYNGILITQSEFYLPVSLNSLPRFTLASNLDIAFANSYVYYGGVHVQIRDHRSGKISRIVGCDFITYSTDPRESSTTF